MLFAFRNDIWRATIASTCAFHGTLNRALPVPGRRATRREEPFTSIHVPFYTKQDAFILPSSQVYTESWRLTKHFLRGAIVLSVLFFEFNRGLRQFLSEIQPTLHLPFATKETHKRSAHFLSRLDFLLPAVTVSLRNSKCTPLAKRAS